MAAKIILAVFVFCAVVIVKSAGNSQRYNSPEYIRIKRAKYFSSQPLKIYRRPPPSYPVKGIFSYTPPPSYMQHDDPPYPGNVRPYKVSGRPANSGLDDEDLNNIVQNLSKQDLDKIIEFTGEKYNNNYVNNNEEFNYYKQNVKENTDNRIYERENERHTNNEFYNDVNQIANDIVLKPVSGYIETYKGPYANNYNDINPNPIQKQTINLAPRIINNNAQDLTVIPLDTQESMKNNEFSLLKPYSQSHNGQTDINVNEGYGNNVNEEEQLPKPVNLRDSDDYDVSYTNNVPTVVKASSYKVESFGELPLMEYNSKLHTVSSYHVPHYSVISSPTQQQASSQLVPSPQSQHIKAPKLEAAPPPSAAKQQSDAHLKAIKIWTHQSRGMAYTLHDDGTLSLERPGRPKPV